MRKSLSSLFTVLVTILVLCAPSHASDSEDAVVAALLKASGVTAQMDALAKTMFSVIPADAFPDGGAKTKAESSVTSEAGPEILIRTVEGAVKADFQRNHAEAVLHFFATPLGKKLRRASEASSSPAAIKEIQEGGALVTNLTEERRKVLEQIVASQDAAQFGEKLVDSSLKELLLGFGLAMGKDDSEAAQLRKEVEKARKTMSEQGKDSGKMALAAAAQTFRSFSDAEIQEVAAYLESDPAVWFRKAVQAGVNTATPMLMKALGKALAGQGG